MSSQAYEPVRKLASSDAIESFDCGQSELNQFLQRFALVNQKSNNAQTYVSCNYDHSEIEFLKTLGTRRCLNI